MDLNFLLGLKPEQISAYFAAKTNLPSWNWKDVWQDAHNKSFTVAKVMRDDILTDIKDAMQRAIDDGETFEQFKFKIEPILREKGWWGKVPASEVPGNNNPALQDGAVQLGSPRRLKTIYMTNINVSYAVGHYNEMIANVDARPYWQYNAVMDKRTRPMHAFFNGLVFRYDDPIWDKLYPPNDWGCRCWVSALSQREVESRGIKIAEGNTFSEEQIRQVVADAWAYNPGKYPMKWLEAK